MHVGVLETSDDDGVWTAGGMPHLIVHTVGRKSGSVHKIALPTWTDPDGHRIVVASYAGAAKDPAWFLNLRDGGGAEVLCIAQRGRYLSVPEVLVGDDYDRIWRLLTGDRAWYLDYQSKTDRRIPLIRLPEPRSAPRQPG